jgi:hypothetical protein
MNHYVKTFWAWSGIWIETRQFRTEAAARKWQDEQCERGIGDKEAIYYAC